MDEFHYYGDEERGVAWQIPLIAMRDSVFLLMSATLGDTAEIARRLSEFTDRKVSVITNAQRPVPLAFEYRESHTHETVESLVQEGNAPVYLVNFTQRDCAEQAQNLMSINVTSKDEKKEIARQLEDVRFDTPYGKEFSRFIRHGIGVHHAGLLPRYRRVVEKLAQQGLVKVISGTDTLGVGVNIPIRTVVIRQLYKFNGEKQVIVSAREFHQIAGRAGRKGFDDRGLVVVQAPEWVVENRRIEAKLAANPHLKNKLRKKSPPPRALPWDEQTFVRLRNAEPEALEPRFTVTHGMMVNLLQSASENGGGYRRLIQLIGRSHGTDADKRERRRRAAKLMHSLRRADIVRVERTPAGNAFVVSDRLQKDFSLNHALSLYLVQTIPLLEQDETHGLKMLTLVESILENPRPVLLRQVDLAKDELVAELKAEGVPYEERMEKLEKVTWPKPELEFIEESFAAFCMSHPWVDGEDIHPKNVAREMYERCFDFNLYVQHLGIARSEGVLLRYLSQVYKAAVQNVPRDLWTPEFEDILAFFHGIVRRVDATLIEEWTLLMEGPSAGETESPVAAPTRRPSVLDDPRSFKARVRDEMHALLQALARKDFEQAALLLHADGDHAVTPDELDALMAPFFADHDAVDLTPLARAAHNTVMREDTHGHWTVFQKVIAKDGSDDFGIECVVDLVVPRDETGPLISLRRLGV